MKTNVDLLREKISDFCDCAIISDEVNRRYFTGMKSSDGTLVVFSDKAYFIIDFRYIEKARKVVTDCEVILQNKLYMQINHLLKKHNAKNAVVDSANCTLAEYAEYKKMIKVDLPLTDKLTKVISELRITKSSTEINKMIAAQRIAEMGFEHMLEYIKPDKTEREIQLELDYYMLSHGAEALSFDTIALSGKNTSLPHGVPSDKIVCKGEFVLMDFGAVVDGWHSDMTRTVCVGKPDDEMEKVYDIVLEAQQAAIEQVRSGMKCKDFDKIARDIISDAGYGDNFGHSLGHGVGMQIHEEPFGSPNSDTVLREDMIITVEPGIYIENRFGVRIEDFVIVKDNGCVNMTKAPKELIIL